MNDFFSRSQVFLRERKSLLIPAALLVAIIIAFVLVSRGCESDDVDWARQIEQIEKSNEEAIRKINDAHEREKIELEANNEQLRRQLEESQAQYEQEKRDIEQRRSVTAREIIDRSAGNPSIVARELAELFELQYVERAEK